jgi:hypothetical protein
MSSQPDFIRRQYEFAAHIRDPEHVPVPADVEDRRMNIYRELFYNNVEGFLTNTFPVLRTVYKDDDWYGLVRDFYAHHLSHTPLFLEIPREFLNWLENEHTPRPIDPDFLFELAHYEWVELALSISEAQIDETQINRDGSFEQGIPVLSPLAWHLAYRYPVHTISTDNQPVAPGEQATHLVVYRDCEDEIGFMEINPVTKRMLELIESSEDRSGLDILTQIADELSHPQPETVIKGGLEIMENLRAKDILPGTRR